MLNAAEQRTLRQIAILRGGFTRESVTAERFQMRELLRQFAAEQLAYVDELAAVEAQYSHF